MLKNMVQKELIYRESSPESQKKQLYFATEKGLALNDAHIKYDDEIFGKTLEFLRDTCSEEDIATCFHVLKELACALRRKHYQS